MTMLNERDRESSTFVQEIGQSQKMALWVATAKKADSISKCAAGSFTGIDSEVIVSKSTHFEIHAVEDTKLRLVLDHDMYCAIADLHIFRDVVNDAETKLTNYRKPGEVLLFVLTDRHDYCIFSWSKETSSLVVESRGDTRDRTGTLSSPASKCLVDHEGRFLALYGTEGVIKFITRFGERAKSVKGKLSNSYLKRKASDIDLTSEFFSCTGKQNRGDYSFTKYWRKTYLCGAFSGCKGSAVFENI
ncbi:hypothetical protein BC829DRAFT_294773 [Chytridium lagenaria]|nr:hypothetical protein BC829DRAFT_294773 [Chytridium lagenaria]